MKKILKLFLLLVVLFITPNVFAKGNVSIESVSLVSKSDSVTEVSQPTIKGLDINFDLSFVQIGDNAKYKIVVTNPTTKDYEISKNNSFDDSAYIKYTYEFDKTNVVKCNSKLTMYVTIKYDKAVPSNKLVNGKYVENNKMAISLSNGKITNPKTGISVAVILSLLIIVGITLLVFKKTKSKNYISILVITLLLIPASAYALERIQININTKVTIEEKYEFSYSYWTVLTQDEAATFAKALTNSQLNELNDIHDRGTLTADQYYNINGSLYTWYFVTVVDGYYSPGEEITVKDVELVPYIGCNDDNSWTGSDTEGWICHDATIAPKITTANDYTWIYETKDRNDIANMNFTGAGNESINNYYDYNHILIYYYEFKTPKKFTMPAHNVNIYSD